MKGIRVFMLFVSLCGAGDAFATFSRTAVSVHGLDTNPCTTVSPCRSFSAAIMQTSAGGEVIALDSAGYGTFNILQPLTVEAAPGVYAGITVPSSGVGVYINVSGVAALRGLMIVGVGGSNTGIEIEGSSIVHIENCVITGVSSGVFDSGTDGALFIDHTVIRDCSFAVQIPATVTNTGKTFINESRFESLMFIGIIGDSYANIVVRDSVIDRAGNTAVMARTGLAAGMNQTSHIVLDNCLIAHAPLGIKSQGTDAVVTVSRSTITRNTTGLSAILSAEIRSLGNNNLEENGTAGSFTSTVPLQ